MPAIPAYSQYMPGHRAPRSTVRQTEHVVWTLDMQPIDAMRNLQDGKCWCGREITDKRRNYCTEDHKWLWYKQVQSWYGLVDIVTRESKCVCNACGKTAPDAAEIDHITPIADGGPPLDRNNLQLLCGPCHRAKTGREARARAIRKMLKKKKQSTLC